MRTLPLSLRATSFFLSFFLTGNTYSSPLYIRQVNSCKALYKRIAFAHPYCLLTMKKDSKLVAWRLSKEAREILEQVAKETGLSKSRIVELCVSKHALELPGIAKSVKKQLVEFVARQFGQNENKE